MRRWTLLGLLVGTSLFLGACPQPPPMNTPMKPANTASARVRPRVLVEPILSTTALFPEELALVQADVERFIAGQTLAPVDLVAPAEVTAMAALARSGRTREGGAVCALPPSLPRLLRARYPGAFAANVALSCGKTDCALELGLRAGYTQLGTWGSSPIERLGTGPKSAVMLDAWRTAARELMSPPPIVSPAADTPESILVANNERDVVTLDHVQPVGAWKVPMPSLATFAPQQAAFAACGVPARGQESTPLLLSVATSGEIDRCDGISYSSAQSERARCYCAALKPLRFPPESAGLRRIGLAMRSARAIPSGLLGRVNSVQSTDPDVTMEGLALPDSADRCAALHVKATESTPAIMVFRIRVDGRGQALESELVRATPPLSEPARACFVEALRAARTSCTATGQEAQIETQLRYDYLAPAPRPR